MDKILPSQFYSIIHPQHADTIKLHDRTLAPKVLVSREGEIIKIFYPKKKWFTSNRFNPRAVRFAKNAQRLTALGISAPEVTQLCYCPALKIHVMKYRKVLGQETRELVHIDGLTLLGKIIEFVANLHEQGIFFRSIHLGNIIYYQQRFSLIDITDVRFKRKALGFTHRLRNLKHLFLNREDKQDWHRYGIEQCLNLYFQHSNLSHFTQLRLRKRLLKLTTSF